MDEEDSQDELINKNSSYGKSKRPSASILSDEEEDGDDSLEEGSDSEEDDFQDEGVEEENEDEEEDESDHEDGVKEVGEALQTEAADLGLSSDEDAEKCPICLNSFHEQPVATPQNCEHYFCLDCILEWAKNANSCPVDRRIFSNILLRSCYGGKVQKTITVQRPVTQEQEQQVNVDLEQTSCEVCGGTDREDRLLLCDGCDAGYHMECLTPPLDAVPVEEWFCPECAPNSLNSAAERLSEEESSLPTTSRSRPAGARPMRAIARTQHSERVRANVNRHRITQARTAAQLAPQYLMRSTWLDETINAVVAGLNTAVYVRDLTPRPRTRRRRKRAPRKKNIKEGKDVKGKTSTAKVKRRKRKARRSKSKKVVVRKKTAQGRIAQSLGMKKPVRSSTIPSVYRPCEQTLGSMRMDIGAASLSIYGDPFDLDPFDNGNEEMEHAPVQPSLLEAKRRGLSRSALRSHQPVARPILAGLSRPGSSIPQVEEVAEAAPVPDLLGSILSGQSLLLMDSSDVVINRDGTLKALKPACLSSSRSSISASERTLSTGAADLHSSREPVPSTSPFTNVSQTLQPTPSKVKISTSCPTVSHAPTSVLEHPHLSTSHPRRPTPANSNGTGHSQLHTCSIRGQPSVGVANGALGAPFGERQSSINTSAKKPPPKPVWVDVSVLPRIPKIKRENSSVTHSSRGSNSNNLPESSMTSLAGDKGRQKSVDQQKASGSRQSRPIDGQRQRLDRAVPSPSFSNSFSTPSTSASLPSNSQTPSSAVSFRIKSSGNPWQARRISVPGQALSAKNKEEIKRDQKDKQMLSYLQTKKTSVESEVYDPFNPTGSDASDSDDENKKKITVRNPQMLNEDAEHEIKTEPMDLPVDSKVSGKKGQVKEEPASPKSDSWSSPSYQPAIPVVSDAEDCKHSEGHVTNILDNSKSSLPSSHHSDKNVKIEVNSEPEHEPSPEKSPAVFQITKGNKFIHEQSSISESSDVNHKCKKKEQSSSCSSSGEEKRLQCVSNSSPFQAFEQSDKQKKHFRSEDRRRSRSKSPQRRQFCSRSQEQSHIRDKRRSARSSSSESSSKRTKKHENRDRYDSREKEGQKRSKKKRYAHSRSRSRSRSRSKSRERRRERTLSNTTSSKSKDKNEMRSNRKRSRSTSRDRRRRENILESFPFRHRQTDKSIESTSAEKKEFTRSIDARNTNAILVKDSKKGHNECDATIKNEAESSIQESSQFIDEPEKQISEDVLSIRVSHRLHEFKPIEIKEEKDSPISNIEESKLLKVDLPKVKVEQIWPDEDSCSDNDALVINLSPPGPASLDCETVDVNSTNLPLVPKEEMEIKHLQAPCSVKHEKVDYSDEEINVDYLIDNLDFIKKEIKDEPVANTAGATEPEVKESTGVQQEMESVLVIAGTKTKSQGKRVTWNIQEPVVSQPDKMSRLALFKLKLKQEGSRKAATSSSMQITSQVAAAVPGGSKSASTSINSLALEGRSNSSQEKSKSRKGELLVNPDPKDKYMKKLHMQERAIEEVKLAIKPFYQKRDITKEEYKEILRKAVQKVCHSKSGEINPVKVANLVKAYVDKYKHARKHRKAEDQQHSEGPKASETPA
ncbi:PHD and RING finger domain-containing protein 1 [Bagarius yarrelli]|uniref:PHD and RING finger domain-containing protein 1 n=1 Tax=Bagarius yarrelli TaxID=175774 RepID=A0A556TRJ3_BAGYA|nr:PHD and RING finger domain-containing protein 1 [Bagarius yarrelli]